MFCPNINKIRFIKLKTLRRNHSSCLNLNICSSSNDLQNSILKSRRNFDIENLRRKQQASLVDTSSTSYMSRHRSHSVLNEPYQRNNSDNFINNSSFTSSPCSSLSSLSTVSRRDNNNVIVSDNCFGLNRNKSRSETNVNNQPIDFNNQSKIE